MRRRKNKNLIVFISCFLLLIPVSGAYFAYYLPFELASNRIKEISTPKVPTVKKKIPTSEKNETKEKVIVSEEPKKEPEKVVELPVAGVNDYDSVDRPNLNEILSADGIQSNESISIESVGLNLNIIRGTNKTNMLYGATTMIEGQKMGKGNYALAGHHMPRNDLLFSPLMDIQKGAIIVLKNPEQEFKYKVIETKVVDYKDGASVLKQTEKPMLTLITCDKPTTTNGRFIVVAELIN